VWWLWPHLRRLWAGVGTITAGLVVTFLYSLLSEQALPLMRIAVSVVDAYWPWLTGTLLALAVISIAAEPEHRQPRSTGLRNH
jgi:hypothetical protein